MTQICIGTPLSEDEISAALDHESSVPVVEHLARCPFCRHRLEQTALMEADFSARLYRFDCPDPLVLCDYQFGLLAAHEAQQLRAHADGCPRCTAELASFAALDPPVPMPLPQPTPKKPGWLNGGLRTQLARLITYSPPPSLARGLRGADDTHVALYEVPELRVLLTHTAATAQAITVAGEIGMTSDEPDQVAGMLVQLFQDQTPLRSTFVDEFSCFSVEAPAPGAYTLCLHLRDQLILIEIAL
jgi:anti-sigma factor RsiW